MVEIKTEAELLQQNEETHRDEGSDIWKLKGTTRAHESRSLIANFIASVFNGINSFQPAPDGAEWVTAPTITLTEPVAPATDWTVTISAAEAKWDGVPVSYAAKNFTVSLPGDPFQRVDSAFADRNGNIGYVSGRAGLVGIDPPIPVGTLPVGNTYWNSTGGSTVGDGTTINSTDDIPTEGVVNKWFTEARVIATRLTANLWSYIGLADAASTISLKGWLDWATNKIKGVDDRVATLEAGAGAGGAGTFLAAFGSAVDAGITQAFLTDEILNKRPTYQQVPSLTQAQKDALAIGVTNVFTATKQPDGSVQWGAGVSTLNKFGPPALASHLADSNSNWNGDRITLMGTNTNGELGRNAQEFFMGRRWYVCESSTDQLAIWLRNASIDVLDTANSHDASIISALNDEAGWVNNIKQLTIKSCKGDEFTSDTGYVYTCYSNDNRWRRVGQPQTDIMFARSGTQYTTLITKLEAHDFSISDYNAKSDTAGYATSDLKGHEGLRYYSESQRKIFECVRADSVKILWRKG